MSLGNQSRSSAAWPCGAPDVTARWSAPVEAPLRHWGPRVVARGSEADAARAFYRDVLGGSEVWRTGADEPRRALSFIVRGTLVDVSLDADGPTSPIELCVDDPEELAERCWDAGYVVRVHDDVVSEVHLSVVDPFGRGVALRTRPTQTSPRSRAGEEQV